MTGGRRHGFLCQSHASTAVCIPGDSRSAIVPRRLDRSFSSGPPKLADLKYSRLVQSSRYSTGAPPPPAGCTPHDRKLVGSNVVRRPERTLATVKAANTSKAIVFAPPPPLPPPPKPPTVAASAPTTYGDVFQVVVMRVSIHCQGCACKVRKHISKMEGVTSFSIDLETKRVTVMGHISPLGVLESISKVKKAEFWQG